MQISVNGQVHELDHGTTVAELLVRLKLQPRQVAVERNLDIVPRAQHDECVLRSGDSVEIVTLVGGG